MKPVPALQPKGFGEETEMIPDVGICFPRTVWWGGSWGWDLRALAGKGRVPLRTIQGYFKVLLGGHKATEDFCQLLQHIPVLETRLFHSRIME